MTVAASTALRARYQRSRKLSVDRQTQECIDYLQNPEILVAEFSDSFLMAEALDQREDDFAAAEELPMRRRAGIDAAVERMIEAPALKAIGTEQYCFSYVARDISPLWKQGMRADGGAADGLDYVGLTREAQATPILGVVNAADLAAPFVSLLRLLACLAEVGTDGQIERADRFLFKGAVPERVPFDLHILIVGRDDAGQRAPLAQLTHDLAAIFSAQLREEWALPPLVRHILCLRMPPPELPFDGILREDWRV